MTTAAQIVSPGSGVTLVQDWTANLLSVKVQGLAAGTGYAFGVAVRDSAGLVTAYPPVTVTTP